MFVATALSHLDHRIQYSMIQNTDFG